MARTDLLKSLWLTTLTVTVGIILTSSLTQAGHLVLRISEGAVDTVMQPYVQKMSVSNFQLNFLTLSGNTNGLRYELKNPNVVSISNKRGVTDFLDGGKVKISLHVNNVSMTFDVSAEAFGLLSIDESIAVSLVDFVVHLPISPVIKGNDVDFRVEGCQFNYDRAELPELSWDSSLKTAAEQIVRDLKEHLTRQKPDCTQLAQPLISEISSLLKSRGSIIPASVQDKLAVNLTDVNVTNSHLDLIYQISKTSSSQTTSSWQLPPFDNTKDFQLSFDESVVNDFVDATLEPHLKDKNNPLITGINQFLTLDALGGYVPRLKNIFPENSGFRALWQSHSPDVTVRALSKEMIADLALVLELWATSKCETVRLVTARFDVNTAILANYDSSGFSLMADGINGTIFMVNSSVGNFEDQGLGQFLFQVSPLVLRSVSERIPKILVTPYVPSGVIIREAEVKFKRNHLIYEANLGPGPTSYPWTAGKILTGTQLVVKDVNTKPTALGRQQCPPTKDPSHSPSLRPGLLVLISCFLVMSTVFSS